MDQVVVLLVEVETTQVAVVLVTHLQSHLLKDKVVVHLVQTHVVRIKEVQVVEALVLLVSLLEQVVLTV